MISTKAKLIFHQLTSMICSQKTTIHQKNVEFQLGLTECYGDEDSCLKNLSQDGLQAQVNGEMEFLSFLQFFRVQILDFYRGNYRQLPKNLLLDGLQAQVNGKIEFLSFLEFFKVQTLEFY